MKTRIALINTIKQGTSSVSFINQYATYGWDFRGDETIGIFKYQT
jgi:hypothetical protein